MSDLRYPWVFVTTGVRQNVWNRMKLTQPLRWHGGKHYMASEIVKLLPPHTHYVEPFFGGGSVLLEKSGEGVSEVVNDLSLELTSFWRVLGNVTWFGMFRRRVEATPFSEFEFKEASGSPLDIVDRAVKFFIRNRQSRQGLMKDFATMSRNRTRRGMNEQVSSWLTTIEGLPEVHARLRRVVIMCKPALEVIRRQDGENSFFYCDPPYLHSTRSTNGEYDHEMSDGDHAKLLLFLSQIKGKFLLSGYPSEMYDSAARSYGWYTKDFDLPNNASSSKEKERRIERVWANYKLA